MTAHKVSALFNIEPGEGRLVMLMLACSFFVGSSVILADTAAYALFVSQFGARGLPYVYMAMSLVVTSSSFAYLKLSARLSIPRLLILTITFGLLLLIGMRLGLSLTAALWLTFALPVGSELANSFTRIAFWNLAGRVFNVRQAKRLFGLIGAGSELAGTAGGLAIPVLVLWIGTPNLLLAAAAAVALALCLILWITRSYAASQAAEASTGAQATGWPSASAWWRNRYILLILGLFALYVVIWFTVDVVFYDQASMRFAGEDQLASFLGLAFGIIGLLNLLGHSFLTSPLLKRYGVRGGLLLTPVSLIAGSTLVVLATAFGAVAVIFWLVAGMYFLFYFLTSSIDMPVLNILYQPLPAAQRLKTQAWVEGVVYSASVGLSGLVLWAFTTFWNIGPAPLSYVVLLLAMIWAGFAVVLGREYPHKLRQALARRRLGTTPQAPVDGSTEAILRRELLSPSPGVVSYALTMLEEMGPQHAAPCLPALLDHPAAAVRKDALQRMERLRLTDAAPAVRQRLALETSPDVRGAALRTLAALTGSEAFEFVSSFLQDPAPEIRRGAAVGLLRHGGIEGVLTAGNRVLQMAGSPQAEERVLAAQILGEVGAASFYQPLAPLLRDTDVQVQRAALHAAGQLKNERLWPLVVGALGSPGLRGTAVSALVAGGDAVLPTLFAAFAEAGAQPRLQRRLVSVAGRVGGNQAANWLKDCLGHPDPAVRTEILEALCRCDYQAVGGEVPQVVEHIKAEAALSARILATQADIGQVDSTELLQSALRGMLADSRMRIFSLLSFLHERQSILQARDNLSLASADRRAYALEILDVLISSDLKKWFFPLVSDLPADERGRQVRALFPQPAMSPRDRLEEIIANSSGQYSAWLRSCALYAAGASAAAPTEAVASAATARDPLIRETALWALKKLETRLSGPVTGYLESDLNQPLAMTTPYEGVAGTGENSMLTTVEKVLALKRAAVFADVPDEFLVDVASSLVEVETAVGQTIFHKGDLGASMYIIADGGIRIHDGTRTLEDLGAGEVFGEMAALDAEPRSASATATADALLLRLDRETLYELMEDRMELACGIIRTLCGRLRARLSDLSQLRLETER